MSLKLMLVFACDSLSLQDEGPGGLMTYFKESITAEKKD